MFNRVRVQIFFLFMLIFTSQESAQVNSQLADTLQHTLDSQRIAENVMGISAAVILPDNNIWIGTSGMSDPETHTTITPDMLFGIGSITKTFTTAIIMQLAAENKLSLNDSLYKWLPEFPNIDCTITIKNLLTHTSGIYNYTNNSSYWNACLNDLTRKFTSEEVLTFVRAPSFVKGTSWEYSNTNFVLLGMIIKKVTGNSFSDELHKRITIPFNLKDTFLDVEDSLTGAIANAWTNIFSGGNFINFSINPRTAVYSSAWTAGGMFSTAEDMARWAKYLYSGSVVEQNYLDQMVAFTSISGYFYGMGTIRTVFQNHVFWGHSGGVPGYNTYTGYSSQDNISIAVLLNRDSTNPENVVSALVKVLLEFKPVSVKEKPPVTMEYSLSQNYPNPFNPETNFEFRVASASGGELVTLKLYDLLGKQVASLVNEVKPAGEYKIKYNAGNLPSGVYFYELVSGDYRASKKFMLIK